MQSTLKFVALTALLLAVAAYTVFPLRCEIRSPRIGQPEILKPGSAFTIRVKHSFPYAYGDWHFRLQGAYGDAIELPVTRKTGLSISEFQATLPETIAKGAYSLVVHYGASVKVAVHAVHVVDSFNRDLKIVQLADLPTLGHEKGEQQLNKIVDEINIINPDLVLFTGDVAYGASWYQYHRLYEIVSRVRPPMILAPGNHEYYGWAGYLTSFGQPYHAVQYGDYRIISLNSGHGRDQFTFSQIKWFKRQLESSEQSQRIVQLHHPIFHRAELTGYLRGNAKQFTDLIKRHKVSIVLSGHWHGDSLYNEKGEDVNDSWRVKGTPFVVTTTAGADFRPSYSSSPLHYGYRLIRYRDAELENFTYDYDGDGERDSSSSIPFNNLSVVKTSDREFLIKNALNEGFKNALVHLQIQDTSNDFYPSQGHIAEIHQHPHGTDYWVKLDIPAQRQISISMLKQDACP